MATIQGIYIALFGRPADPGGLAYWNGITNNGSDLSKLIGQLTASAEYTARFQGKTSAEIVTTIYQSLFGRAPDAAGLDFFTKGLANGTLKLETLAINILDGAQGADKTVVDNKTTAADLFTKSIDTPAEVAAYNGTAAAENGRTFLTKVTADKTSIPSQTDVDKAVAGVGTPSGGQGPSDGGAGGSNPSGPSEPTKQANSYSVNAVVANKDNALFVGSGNPANGFAVTKNPNNDIELGLSVRHQKADVALNGVADSSSKVVKFYDQNIEKLTFAYSAQDKSGIDLSSNTYKLYVDLDPTEGTSKQAVFVLEKNTDTNPKAVSGYKWVLESDNKVAIIDDGISTDKTALQNIQPLKWLLDAAGTGEKAGIYDIKLVATDAVNNSTESAIQIHASKATESGEVAKASTGNLWAGSGNSAQKFATVELGDGIKLGLSGRYSGGTVETGKTESDGLVHFKMDNGGSARFAYSIESTNDKKLSDYTFKLKVDINKDASVQDYVVFELNGDDAKSADPVNSGGDSSYSWSKISSHKSDFSKITDDGGDVATGKVTQNIENIAWFDNVDGGKLAAGQYDVVLEAYQGTKLIGTNHVVFDITSNALSIY